MKLTVIAVIFAMSAAIVHAEDFTLKFFSDGPILLHTALSFEGDNVRLVATAKNASASAIQRAQICITSPSMKDGCLFLIWNNALWDPGTEMNWNMTSPRKIPTLAHDAVIDEYVIAQPQPAANVESDTGNNSGNNTRPVLQSGAASNGPETLTNQTLIKLSKAGLGDEVILNMVDARPGQYSKTPDDIVALKQAGLSDKVITAVLNKSGDSTPEESVASSSGAISGTKIETNARLYIAPMTSNLDEFVGAEVVKQHLPVRVVLDEKDADYILSGLSQKTEVKWYDVISGSIVGGKDRLEASAKLVRVRDKTFVWAGESGDRSLIFGALKRGGQRKLAERIVSQMKHDLF